MDSVQGIVGGDSGVFALYVHIEVNPFNRGND
jgi:hypothetical protein